MLQTYFVPAGGRQINAKARFFRYESASANGGTENVRVRADGQDLGTYLPGDSITLPTDAVSWEVTPALSSATCTVRLGVGGVSSSRVFGVVQVVDGGRARTLADRAFIGYISQTAGPGFVPVLQLLNPAAATTRAMVKAIRISTPTAGSIGLGVYNVALPSGPFDSISKAIGGAVSVCKLYRDTPAAPPSANFEAMFVGAGLVVSIALQEPIILGPGKGIIVNHSVAATLLQVTFEIVEEDLTQ